MSPEKREIHRKWYEKRKREDPNFLQHMREVGKRSRLKNPETLLFRNARRRSKENNTDFNIEKSDIVVPYDCPVLNVPMIHNTEHAPSLDRIDNSKGYIKGNIQVISRRANFMKNDANVEELINFARWVIQTYGDPEMEYLELENQG